MPILDAWTEVLTEGRGPRKFEPKVDAALVARASATGPELAGRLRDRQLQLRKDFVRRSGKDKPTPPSAALAASRSEVHLKVALTLLWASAGKGKDPRYVTLTGRDQRILDERPKKKEPVIQDADAGRALLLETDPYVAQFRLPSYAKLLGLPNPKTSGAARVRRSLDELAGCGLIWLDRTNGASPRTQLRREDGSGAPYKLPGEKEAMLFDGAVRAKAEGRYIQLPAAFFTNGWVAALSARAIASYLALLVQQDLDPDGPVFIAPSIRADRYGMSEDSFLRGCAELVYFGLVLHRSAPVQSDWSTSRGRSRHAFVPRKAAFAGDPTRLLPEDGE